MYKPRQIYNEKKRKKVKMKTKHRNVKIMGISLSPRDTWKTLQKIGSKRFFFCI